MLTIPLFRRGAWQPSRDVIDVPGSAHWRLSLSPRLMIATDARAARPADEPRFDQAARRRILDEAIALFLDRPVDLGPLDTQSPAEFHAAMREIVGLPPALSERWGEMLRDCVGRLRPPDARIRRALIVLPANTFTCLEAVAEAVLSADEVWIRPSRREPVSAVRFAAALLAAGWPAERLGFYPCDAEALDALLDATDHHVVFGGDEISARLERTRSVEDKLDLRGAGRGVALVPADIAADPEAAADWLARLIAANSGRFCKNVCTVLCVGDPEPIAKALAARLDAISIPAVDADFPQASVAPARAESFAKLVQERTGAADRRVTNRDLVHLDGAGAYLAPTLVHLADPGTADAPHALLALELPFPFAAICAAGPELTAAVVERSRFVYTPATDLEPKEGTST
ncbi:aldehyde dehydrogenase family protein [Actinospica durhamensis]|uniref:Aldehyde dehydrogenase family protein n=1 Tax=Actinospica durhamensis TaxID=1508375 RepID=A0A941EPC4_9ACTN|nr:aldehyde dehydrogenase family protein [Actinospica durhamensis]MBR7834916.1 aldehyde dehydrogenase family protein [Actinospica durhamensis]